jgi:hypothetical protein
MRFNCNFEDRQSGVSLNVVAILTDAEIQSVERVRALQGTKQASLIARAYALRRAYKIVPAGYRHTSPQELVTS